MRLVRLSDLSEEERKKALEEQQERINKNRQESQKIQYQANSNFNEIVNKKGAYQSTGTTALKNLKKAYKNTPSYNSITSSTNEVYKSREGSLWNKIMEMATTPAGRTNNSSDAINAIRNMYQQSNSKQALESKAVQEYEDLKKLGQIQSSATNYQKKQEEILKSSLSYKQAKIQNPNATEDELLVIAKNNSDTLYTNLIKDIASKNGKERTTELKNISTSDSNRLFYDNNKFRKLNNNVLEYKTSIEAKEEADKINEDLKNGKIGLSVGHILEALPIKAMEAVASPIYSTGSLLNLKLPTGTADQDLQDWKKISSKYDKTTANINNNTVKTASNISGTIGYMVPSILASAIAPETKLGRITQGVSVGGEGYFKNLNDDSSNKFQSAITGVGKGYASYAIEGITGGNILGKGSLDDLAVKAIASKSSNNASKRLASMIYEVGGEVVEEEVENQANYLIDKVVNNKGISLKDWLNEQDETVKNTVLSTLVLKVLGLGGSVYNDAENYNYNAETKKWINEAEKIIQKENLTIDLDKLKVENNVKEVNNVLNQMQQENNTSNSQSQSTQNQQMLSTQQINQEQNKVNQNGNIEPTLPIQRYVYEKSNNVKVNNLRQDASKHWNNSEKTRNYMNMLEKIIQDKNIDIRLEANLTDSQGRVANGSYSNGVIIINPNSTRAGEFIAIHELTHAIGTNQMRIIVEKYRKNNTEFNSAVEQLLENYNSTELTEEAMADVAGKLFGNQEFINNLAQTEPSLFKKIYNEIKYLWHQFTGYKNQDQFINDLQYKWEQAYRNNTKLNEVTNYSVGGIEGLKNITNLSERADGYKRYKEARKMIKQKASNQEIFKKTGWFQDKITGEMKFNFSDKDMDVINKNYVAGKEYKLKDVLKHDTLFEIYPQLENYPVIIEDMNVNRKNKTIKGAYNRYSDIIKLDYRRFNQKADVEGTLIHEIQHAIQKIENFSRGASSEWGKKFYKNSPGEIEARDTTQRLLKEKYNRKDLSNVMPKSGNINPSILDKMRIGLYNYLKDIKNGGESDENISNNQAENSQNISQDNRLVLGRGYRPNGRGEKLLQRYINNSGSFSADNNKTWQEYLNNNFKPTGTRTNLQDIKLPIAENRAIANNQETLYNSFNERESGINERRQTTETIRKNEQERVKGLLPTNEGRQGNVREYQTNNEEKQEIDYIRDTNNHITVLNSNQKSIENRYKDKGVSVKFYSFDSITGGRYDDGTLYINTYNMTDEQQANVAVHEYAHHLLRNNISFQNEISPIADKIISSENEGRTEAIRNYIMDRDENITTDEINKVYEIAIEEILADYMIDIDNNVDFNVNNQYGVDIDILNEYRNLVQRYLPNKVDVIQTKQNILPLKETSKGAYINLPSKQNRILNPTEISNIKLEDVNTTPVLPTRDYKKGNKESSFFSNVVTDAKFLNKDLRQEMAHDENIRYYKEITNAETLEKAYTSLQDGGQQETLQWFNKDTKNVSAEDVTKGWILLKQYQDSGDYQGAVEVAKRMRDMATGAGQTIQAYNILSRLTPEGMFYYAQSELNEAYNKIVEGKSQKWIEENRDKFDLTPEETKFIMDNMNDVANMEDGYDKKVKIAEIQKIVTDKIPPTAGQSIKSWMRISMLFNPKTQVRNILGNAVILPVNVGSDLVASGIDKLISKKTGIRTTGNINLKNYSKGFGKGLYESYNDFRKGINTRNIEGNRFEVSEGKNFKDKGIGRALNRVDNILSFMLDAGDRGFYEATFTNSINNQLVLNNTTEITQEMIDIATNEALQRTWQDNNKYTEAVLKIRNILNYVNIKGYGLGDVLIPFAKTPANLTKAIVDYSPVGLVKAMTLDAKTFKNSLENGQFTPQMQHKFVQNLGKGMAGSFLYVLGYALAKAGIASGEADDDKDIKNFIKNSLGISSYSIKIGDKTFTYDWAQPVATPLAIMTNYVKYSKDNPDANILEKGIKSLNIGTEQLLQQSFMESLNTVLNGNGTTLENLSQAVLELPARAIPTFSKQIAEMVDGTQRTSFEYDKPVKSAVNSVIAKIPFASKTLPVSRDTLGNEIKKYGGENNIWNVMFNPANVNKGELSKSGEEIYRLYQETGETTVFPITAPYYIDSKGKRITMTAEQRSEYQKVTGEYTEEAIEELISNSSYKKLSEEKKAELIADIISNSNAKAKYDILDIETEEAKKKRELIEKVTTKNYYDYRLKTKDIEGENATRRKNEVLLESNYSNKVKSILYTNTTGKEDSLYSILNNGDIDIDEYLEYKIKDLKDEFSANKDKNGNSISGSSKKKIYNYVNNNITGVGNRLIILGSKYKLQNNERKALTEYINKTVTNNEEKLKIFKKLTKNYIVKDGKIYYK